MASDRTKTRHTDISRFLSELNESFSIIIDLEQLRDNFTARLKEIFHTSEIFVFLLHPDLNKFLPVEKLTTPAHPESSAYFLTSDKLIFWLSVNKTFLSIDQGRDIFSFFTQREQNLLESLNAGLIYPFIVMNQVKGLLCIGRKSNGSYVPQDLHQMKVVLDQAGFAFENAYHYHLQKERTRKMYRADRLATLGELAAGAAHEIRNPLTTIRSSIQILKKKLRHPGDIEMADDLIGEVDRINGIIEGMLSFAKPQEPRKENVNLKALLAQSVQLLSNLAVKNNVVINMHYHAANEGIIADMDQLKQVFLNILLNAIQSIKCSEGQITIQVNEVTDNVTYMHIPGTYIIEISDNGQGIAQEYLDKIFDPFFTTKSNGTGLGLSISYGIINRHGGEIELMSEAGTGTKVKIKLPVK